jgi:hypothetical protein
VYQLLAEVERLRSLIFLERLPYITREQETQFIVSLLVCGMIAQGDKAKLVEYWKRVEEESGSTFSEAGRGHYGGESWSAIHARAFKEIWGMEPADFE